MWVSLGPAAHMPLSKAYESTPVNRMVRCLASLCVPAQGLIVPLLLLGVKKGVQLSLLVNKSLERWWEGLPGSERS